MTHTTLDVLKKAWDGGFTTKSDFAREAADVIAMCASLNFITTMIAKGHAGRTWLITPTGMVKLYELLCIPTFKPQVSFKH